MRKKTMKRVVAAAFSVMMAVAIAPWSDFSTVQASTGTASVEYIKDEETGVKTGIRKILYNPGGYDMTFFDLDDGIKSDSGFALDTTTSQEEFYKKVLTSGTSDYQTGTLESPGSILNQWSSLAEAIFKNTTLYTSYINAGGGFEQNFGGANRTRDAGYTDISQALAKPTSYTKGSKSHDTTYISGLQTAKSLSEVRQRAAQQLADRLDHSLSANRFLGATNQSGKDTLSQLEDSNGRTCIYNLVTCIDRQGGTFCYCYNTFGIVFYDFQLTPLTFSGVQYITAAEAEDGDVEEAQRKGVPGVSYETTNTGGDRINYYENASSESVTENMSTTNAHSESVANTISKTNSYTFTEKLGVGVEKTDASNKFLALFGLSKLSFNFEFSAAEAISTAWSKTSTLSDSTTQAASNTIVLPAQTAVAMKTNKGATKISLDYQCPVAVTYKVAIFSMNGKCYDDNAAVHTFNTAGYRQSYFCTMFGSTDKDGTTEGSIASLYNRSIAHRSDVGYEKSYGNTYGYSHRHGYDPTTIDCIDWNAVLKDQEPDPEQYDYEEKPLTINYLEVDKNGVPTGKKLKEIDKVNQYPTSAETRIDADASYIEENTETDPKTTTTYKIYTGEVMVDNENDNADLIHKSGYYYKNYQPLDQNSYDQIYAEKDEDGNPKKDADGKTIYPSGYDEKTAMAETYCLNFYYYNENSDPAVTTVEATDESANDDFAPDIVKNEEQLADSIAWLACHFPMSATGSTINLSADGTNSTVYSIVPLYPLKSVKFDPAYDLVSDSDLNLVNQKELNMVTGDTFDEDNLKLAGYNENSVPYYSFNASKGYWVLAEKDGTEIQSSNIASIEDGPNANQQIITAGEEEGTIYLKYKIKENVYQSKDQTGYTKNTDLSSTAMVKINVTNKPFEGSVVAEGAPTTYVGETLDLNHSKDVDAYVLDSTEKMISGAPITWEAQLDSTKGVNMNESTGEVSFTKTGTFKVRSKYGKYYSNWITVTVKDQKVLDKITIKDSENLLESYIFEKEKDINLSKIRSSAVAVDQYGNDWELTDADWYITDADGKETDGVSLSGDMLHVKKAGTYLIALKEGDVASNALTLEVKAARKVVKVTIEADDLEKDGLGVGDTYKYDLGDVKVTALDQYGDEVDLSKEDISTQWNVGGTYSKISDDTLIGIANGSDALSLTVYPGTDDAVTSNEVAYTVKTMPYVNELYSYPCDTITEGDTFALSQIQFKAKDQDGENYTLSQKELDSLVWSVTDEGSVSSDQVTFDADKKTIIVKEGTLGYGKTGNVILTATFTNKNGTTATAKNIEINVKQQPILDSLKLSKKDADAQISANSSVMLTDFFDVTGLDQYGNAFSLDDVEIGYYSSNSEAYTISEDGKIIKGVTPKASANISAFATITRYDTGDETTITSNNVKITVPKVKKVTSIKIRNVPSILPFAMNYDVSKFLATCYDQDNESMTAADLKALGAKIVFSITNGNTNANIDATGKKLYTGSKYGYVTVIASAADSETGQIMSDINGKDISTSALVWLGYANSINLNKTSDRVLEGTKIALRATVNPKSLNSIATITWKTSNSKVASVDKNGNVTTKTAGKVTITASAFGASASCIITVGNNKGDIVTAAKSSTSNESATKNSSNSVSTDIYRYKITNADMSGKGTVSCLGFIPGKYTANVKIRSSIKVNGITYKVTSIANNAFKCNKKIKTVYTGNNVTEIGKYAFYKIPNLKKVVIGSAVKKINAHAFCKNKKLKNVTFKGTSVKTFGKPHIFLKVKGCKVIMPKKAAARYKKLLKKSYMKKYKVVVK